MSIEILLVDILTGDFVSRKKIWTEFDEFDTIYVDVLVLKEPIFEGICTLKLECIKCGKKQYFRIEAGGVKFPIFDEDNIWGDIEALSLDTTVKRQGKCHECERNQASSSRSC